MSTVSIVYHSGTGHTAALAQAVADGARSFPGTTVHVLTIEGKDIVEGRYQNDAVFAQLAASDAIIFGTPTYMGGPSGQFKCFADATGAVWMTQGWKDKIAGGFTVSGSPSGDKLSTLHYLATLAFQQVMVWVGVADLPYNAEGLNRLGSFAGVMGQAGQEPPTEAPGPQDLATGRSYGKRIAEAAARWKK